MFLHQLLLTITHAATLHVGFFFIYKMTKDKNMLHF